MLEFSAQNPQSSIAGGRAAHLLWSAALAAGMTLPVSAGSRAETSLPDEPLQAAGEEAPGAVAAPRDRKAQLQRLAALLESLSDDEYLLAMREAPAKVRSQQLASRGGVLKQIYVTLAALEYYQASQDAPKARGDCDEAFERVVLQNKEVAWAVAAAPESLQETGWMTDVVKWLGNAAMNYWLNGGTDFIGDEGSSAGKLKKTRDGLEVELSKSSASQEEAGIRLKLGGVYEELASAAAQPEPESERAAKKEARLKRLAAVLESLSDDDFDRAMREVPEQGRSPQTASRAQALKTAYVTLAASQYRQAAQHAPQDSEGRYEVAYQRVLKQDPDAAGSAEPLQDTGWVLDVVKWLGNAAMNYWLNGGTDFLGGEGSKAGKLDKTRIGLESQLAKPSLNPEEEAGLHLKLGAVYEGLATAASARLPAQARPDRAAEEAPDASAPMPFSREALLRHGRSHLRPPTREMNTAGAGRPEGEVSTDYTEASLLSQFVRNVIKQLQPPKKASPPAPARAPQAVPHIVQAPPPAPTPAPSPPSQSATPSQPTMSQPSAGVPDKATISPWTGPTHYPLEARHLSSSDMEAYRIVQNIFVEVYYFPDDNEVHITASSINAPHADRTHLYVSFEGTEIAGVEKTPTSRAQKGPGPNSTSNRQGLPTKGEKFDVGLVGWDQGITIIVHLSGKPTREGLMFTLYAVNPPDEQVVQKAILNLQKKVFGVVLDALKVAGLSREIGLTFDKFGLDPSTEKGNQSNLLDSLALRHSVDRWIDIAKTAVDTFSELQDSSPDEPSTNLPSLPELPPVPRLTPPTAPANVRAFSSSSNQTSISWNADSDNESGFNIERRTVGGAYSQIAIVTANRTGYTDTGLAPSTKYSYRVKAYNSAGDSAYSNEASATTEAPAVTLPTQGKCSATDRIRCPGNAGDLDCASWREQGCPVPCTSGGYAYDCRSDTPKPWYAGTIQPVLKRSPTADRNMPSSSAVTVTAGQAYTFKVTASDADDNLRGVEWNSGNGVSPNDTGAKQYMGASGVSGNGKNATFERTYRFDAAGQKTIRATGFDGDFQYSGAATWTVTVNAAAKQRVCTTDDYGNWVDKWCGMRGGAGCGNTSQMWRQGVIKPGVQCVKWEGGPLAEAGGSIFGCFTSIKCK
ncbi:MAG: fibronectin type III domain-containing protein [Elusimicrobia bacterium]|nr:fibronectin type III domain-containing protein [Elusimicrobiota bacterium]